MSCSPRDQRELDAGARDPRRCPSCGVAGAAVERTTVAALTRGEVPTGGPYQLCRSSDCTVVYFDGQGRSIGTDALYVHPGFKDDSSEALLCYCFLVRRRELVEEIRTEGSSAAPERIARQVRDGNCACEVRNPSGRCCLGELRREIERLQ